MTGAAVLTTAFAQRREQPGVDAASCAPALVAAATAMARRFRAGGVLHAFGADAADAHHIAVEFVHPVIVGKRALPAVAHDAPRAAHRLRHAAAPGDIALAVHASPGGAGRHTTALGAPDGTGPALTAHGAPDDDAVAAALRAAGERGLLTIALTGADWAGPAVDHLLAMPARDPLIVRELHVSAYHLLWELTHVLLERGPAERRT